MTIRRGDDWGEPSEVPPEVPWFADDRAASKHVAGAGDPRFGLSRGDMARTLGSVGGGPTIRFMIDLLQVSWSGSEGDGRTIGLAHVVARRRWGWTGPILAVMNAQYVGEWDIAPRGHPNDGRAEVIDVDAAMSIGQRWLARRRLPVGAHVPHPCIRMGSRDRGDWSFDEELELRIDGESMGGVRTMRVEVMPDAAEVWVRQ